MSDYTTEVRYICETLAGYDESKGYNDVNSILTTSAPQIFNFDFPIFDEAYRLPLEMKILRHYYTREISEETVGLWKLRLQTRLNEIMPYYNKLYETETLEFNPLYDVDYKREYTKESDGTTTGSVTDSIEESRTGANTGTVADAKTGKDTLKDTVSDDLARKGTETSKHTGTDTTANTGTDTSNKTGTDTMKRTGTVSDSGSTGNTETRNYSDATTVGKDSWDLYSDTPQGGINGLLDNGWPESGTDLPNNAYLTNARHVMETGNSGTTTHSGTIGNQGTNTNTRTNDTTDTETLNTQDQRTLNTQSQRTLNTEDKLTRDTTDERDIDGTHETTYASTNTRTLNTHSTDSNEISKEQLSSGTVTNTDEYIEHVYGKTGGMTYAKTIMEYRKSLLNIDMMVIKELKDLFFLLW